MGAHRSQALLTELPPDQAARLSEQYWSAGRDYMSIARAFRVRGDLFFTKLLLPMPASGACVLCGGNLVYTCRSGRRKNDGVCLACKHHHNSGQCHCTQCDAARAEAKHLREEQISMQEAAEETRRAALRQEWVEKYGTVEHVTWALAQLSPAQRLYLSNAIRAFNEPGNVIYWEQIARDYGQPEWRCPGWVRLLESYHLFYVIEGIWGYNPALDGIDIRRRR